MDERKRILTIFGASGATGQEAVSVAAARGWHVRAVEPSWPAIKNLPAGAEAMTADVLKDDLAPVIDGADAVLSCLGVGNDPRTLMDPPPLYTEGTLRIVEAMKAAGVRRLVVISASFVAAKDRGPLHFRLPAMTALRNVFREMAAMERILRASEGVDWTAVRPGWLMDGEPTDDYTVVHDVIPADMIRTRHADLGRFMVDLAGNAEWVRQTPAIARTEPASASSPRQMLREMFG